MAQAIDTLEVIFSADTAPLSACLNQINMQLLSVSGASLIADNSLRSMASALDFGMESLKKQAFNAGAAVGTSFASGLRSKKGAVDSAVKYLTAAALAALNRLLSAKPTALPTPSGAGALNLPDAPYAENIKNAAAQRVIDITVPINVDGIRLGEACIRGVREAAAMSGRAVPGL